MLKVEVRPSLRSVQQIARIERFSGSWERISKSQSITSGQLAEYALVRGAAAVAQLDQNTSPSMLIAAKELAQNQSLRGAPHSEAETSRPEGRNSELERLIAAMQFDLSFDLEGLESLYVELSGGESSSRRTSAKNFLTPDNKIIFATVSPFLIEQRFEELMSWTSTELEADTYHPLIVIGTFYLLFLQLSPFQRHNHTLVQIICWRLLSEQGYDFASCRHFSPTFLNSYEGYFAALRQAEKTAGTSWNTLNIWLEFFLNALLSCCIELGKASERIHRARRLSGVQLEILDVVKQHGSASREQIVAQTGINISTVKYNLSVLFANGHLRRSGGGRTTSYSIW